MLLTDSFKLRELFSFFIIIIIIIIHFIYSFRFYVKTIFQK